MKCFGFFLFFTLSLHNTCWATEDCKSWFVKNKLVAGPECLDRCQEKGLMPLDGLSNSVCVSKCRQLCEASAVTTPKSIFGPFILYPGLTAAEKKLVAENPKEALAVFVQKNIAEGSAQRNFPNGLFNDESDAFRHFVWAGLLVKEIGLDRAQVYLDAHEQESHQTEPEKAMDIANNRQALIVAQKFKAEGKLNLEELEKEGLQELRQKKLIVLEPQGFIPKEPKK